MVGEDCLGWICKGATLGAYEGADIIVDEVDSAAFATGHGE